MNQVRDISQYESIGIRMSQVRDTSQYKSIGVSCTRKEDNEVPAHWCPR